MISAILFGGLIYNVASIKKVKTKYDAAIR